MAFLEISKLSIASNRRSDAVTLVSNVSFSIERAEIFGIVGESGSGKTLSCSSMLSLLSEEMSVSADRMTVAGIDLLTTPATQVRGKLISMIFQDPASSLNPVFSIRSQLGAVLKRHTNLSSSARQKKLHQLLSDVGLNDTKRLARSYPHELSGGMQQRVLIAMALATGAQLLIADEPTTALDVTVQAQILALLKSLREKLGLTVIFISHDLAVVSQLCDRVAVMCRGEIVEQGDISTVLSTPRHDYTRKLLSSSLSSVYTCGAQPNAIEADTKDGLSND